LTVGGFVRRTLQAADESRLLFLSSALTFDVLLAAVPFALLLLAGIGALLGTGGGPEGNGPAGNLGRVLEYFFPPHRAGPGDPFLTAANMLTRIGEYAQRVSGFALLAFLWFSTRAFASIRTALNLIHDVSIRPMQRGFVWGMLAGKARDVVMVVSALVLLLVSIAFSSGVQLVAASGEARFPGSSLLFGLVGRIVGEVIAFGFLLALFLVLYRFGSLRRIRVRAAMVASTFAAIAFEVARRLFSVYIANVAGVGRASIDAGIGTVLLFVLWLYYSALVFLLGGVVAETWELRHLQRRQRADMPRSAPTVSSRRE
jgi:membrane protein